MQVANGRHSLFSFLKQLGRSVKEELEFRWEKRKRSWQNLFLWQEEMEGVGTKGN